MTISQAVEGTGPGNTVAKAGPPTARALVDMYSGDFARVLPSHIKPDTWVRITQAALKTGQMDKENPGKFLLEVAAASQPGKFLSALLRAASEGLMPGTPEFYLTPRRVKGRWEILGIVGYQGMIERMYRAGAVSTVICEVVHANDEFTYRRGIDERPVHVTDWDAEPGDLRLVYAYAVMKDGATSKVIVLTKFDIAKIQERSDSYKNAIKYNNTNSPWFTDPEAMWMKSAIRRLEKWVPTSSEYFRQQMQVAAEVADDISTRQRADVRINLIDDEDAATDEVLEGSIEEDIDEVTGEVRDALPTSPSTPPEPEQQPPADVDGPLLPKMGEPPTGPDPWDNGQEPPKTPPQGRRR